MRSGFQINNMADNPCVLVKRCNSDLSCCGIVLDSVNGIVLTVASLFLDVLPEIENQRTISSDCSFRDLQTSADGIAVEVIFRRHGEEKFSTLQGYVGLFWRDLELQRIAQRIFPSSEWKLELSGQSEAKTTLAAERNGRVVLAHRNSLSDFVLIEVKTLKNYFSCSSLNLLTLAASENPKKGETVFIVGTPFGGECPSVFYNSLSKGIVSNVVGTKSEIMITDARCVPGCEGCPVYRQKSHAASMKDNAPYGIVLAPFCWRNGEWIGITVTASLEGILRNLLTVLSNRIALTSQNLHEVLLGISNNQVKIQNPRDAIVKLHQGRSPSVMHSNQGCLSFQEIVNTALCSVVMVLCGNTWGSGIVIDVENCLIATCSHVIQDCHETPIVSGDKSRAQHLNNVSISFNCPYSTQHEAQVLYATKEGCPLDFALLKVQPDPELRSLVPRLRTDSKQGKSSDFCTPLCRKGEDICVVGFQLFARHLNIGASVVSGVISNISYADNRPLLLQSTAAVHCGASGGALVSMETGELLGMITSHTKDSNLSSSFPHVNFSIPTDLLYKLVSAFKNGVIEDTVQQLVSGRLASVWQLKNTVNEKPHFTSKL